MKKSIIQIVALKDAKAFVSHGKINHIHIVPAGRHI